MTTKKKTESKSTSHPSHPHAFKSFYCVEDAYWDAQIKVDYDTHRNPFDIRKVARALRVIKDEQLIKTIMVFKTGKGHHLRVWLKNLMMIDEVKNKNVISAPQTLKYQSLLGDDPKRQKFNRNRVKRGEPFWNVLWRMKVRNGVIVSKEEELVDKSNQLIEMVFNNAKR